MGGRGILSEHYSCAGHFRYLILSTLLDPKTGIFLLVLSLHRR